MHACMSALLFRLGLFCVPWRVGKFRVPSILDAKQPHSRRNAKHPNSHHAYKVLKKQHWTPAKKIIVFNHVCAAVSTWGVLRSVASWEVLRSVNTGRKTAPLASERKAPQLATERKTAQLAPCLKSPPILFKDFKTTWDHIPRVIGYLLMQSSPICNGTQNTPTRTMLIKY